MVDGRVVAQAEVDEARLFLEEARRAAGQLPAQGGRSAVASIDSVLQLVAALAPPDTVAARVRTLSSGLAERFRVTLDELPPRPPQLSRGAEVYQSSCASCHGVAGAGDGPMASRARPGARDLTDWKALSDQSPLDYYRRISIGVVGDGHAGLRGPVAGGGPLGRGTVRLAAAASGPRGGAAAGVHRLCHYRPHV